MKRIFKKFFKVMWNIYGIFVTVCILVGMYQAWYHPSEYLSEQIKDIKDIQKIKMSKKES